MKRRTALGVLGGVAGGPLLMPLGELERLLAWGRSVRAGRPGGGELAGGDPGRASLLTPERARVMEAMGQVILPATDTPGASEAGVSEFVAALVDGWLDDDDRDRFLAGIDAVDPACRGRFGADFAECAPGDQAAFVGELDREVSALRDDPEADEALHFFHDVKRFTLTAYFTSEAGLAALGHRTVFRTFEGCAPLDPFEGAPADPAPHPGGTALPVVRTGPAAGARR